MTLLINLYGGSALTNVCLIFGISSDGKLTMRVALFKSPMIAFHLYHFRTFDDQWTGNFLSLRLSSVCVKKIIWLYLNCIFQVWMVPVKLLKEVTKIILVSSINNTIHKAFVKFSFGWIEHFTLCFHHMYIWKYNRKGSTHCATTAQKIKFSIKDFFSKCDQICRKLLQAFSEK